MDWDHYFLGIAKAVSENSKCRSRKIGAILVQDKSIVSTGYNGPPAGMRPCDERWSDDGLFKDYPGTFFLEDVWQNCPRRVLKFPSGQGLDLCVAGHAERNSILQAAKLGISTKGATMYAYCGRPCKDCAIEIVNAGIVEVVHLKVDYEYDQLSKVIFAECGIKLREVEFNG